MSVTFLLLVLKNLKKYHQGDFAGHCPIHMYLSVLYHDSGLYEEALVIFVVVVYSSEQQSSLSKSKLHTAIEQLSLSQYR